MVKWGKTEWAGPLEVLQASLG